jgi:hypothetical protein
MATKLSRTRLGNIDSVVGTSSAIGRIIRKCYRGEIDVNDGVKYVQMLAVHRDTLLMAHLEQRMLEIEAKVANDPASSGVFVLPPPKKPKKKEEKVIDLTALVKGPPTEAE